MNAIESECWKRLVRERDAATARLQWAAMPWNSDSIDSTDEALTSRVRTSLDSINEALDRMATGQFGVCVECKGPIEPDRLRALPATGVCSKCQRKLGKTIIGRHMLWRTGPTTVSP